MPSLGGDAFAGDAVELAIQLGPSRFVPLNSRAALSAKTHLLNLLCDVAFLELLARSMIPIMQSSADASKAWLGLLVKRDENLMVLQAPKAKRVS